MAGTLPPGGGSSMPAGKQVKKVGSDASKMNVPYFNQQQTDSPPTGPTTRHPNQVQPVGPGQQQEKARH